MSGPLLFGGLVVVFAVFLWWLGRPLRMANASLRKQQEEEHR